MENNAIEFLENLTFNQARHNFLNSYKLLMLTAYKAEKIEDLAEVVKNARGLILRLESEIAIREMEIYGSEEN